MQEKPECTLMIASLGSLEELIIENSRGVFTLNETTNQNLKIKLERLRLSIDEFSKKDNNLTYIGFMGHYSSGKSSTINSLFEFGDDEKRNVGHNPTDKQITLVTSKNNEDKLFQMVREGTIPVRSVFISSEELKNLVVIDTPGSGDPGIASELVQDFLPICDILYYVISCANPLDSADIPLLQEKQSRLPFIPIKFVLTRADEFKTDIDKALNDDNFDEAKYLSFLSELKSRIESQLKTTIKKEDFICIDNRSSFRNDILKNEIQEYSKASNSQAVSNHSHKVNYYRTICLEIKNVLLSEIQNKISDLNTLLVEARSRISDYDDAVNIKNNDLTNTWSVRLNRINSVYSNLTSKAAKEDKQIELTESLWSFGEYIKWVAGINQNIVKEAEFNSKKILETLERRFREQLVEKYSKKLNYISETKSLKEIEGSYLPSTEDISITLESYESVLLSHSLNSQVSSFWNTIERILKDLRFSVNQNLSTLSKRIDQKHPLTTFSEEVDLTKQSLDSDINSFLQVVKLYRAGVLTNQAKQYIAKLSLGETLDEYDTELPESDVIEIKNDAFSKFCPQYLESSNAFISRASDLKVKVKATSNDLPSMITITSPFKTDEIFEPIDSLSIVSECKSEILSNYFSLIKPVIENFNGEIEDIYKRQKSSLEASLSRKDKDLKSLLKLIVGILFIFFSVAGYFIYGNVDVPDKVGPIILLVFAGIWVGDIYTNFISKPILGLFNKSEEENIEMCFESFQREFTKDYSSKVDKLDEVLKTESLESSLLISKIRDNWNSQFSRFKETDESKRGLEYYDSIRNVNNSYGELLTSYLEDSKNVYDSISGYYSNVSKNLEILKGTSSHIKSISIEPSFKFLESMMDKLKEIETNINKIDF